MRKKINSNCKHRILLLLAISMGFWSHVFSQETQHAIWTGASIELGFGKKWEVQLEEQLRVVGSPYNFDQLLTQIGVEYKLSKYFRPSIAFRKTFENGGQWSDRLDLITKLRYRTGKWKFQNRLKFQTSFKNSGNHTYKLRNKFEIEYQVKKKFTPFAFGELFYGLNSDVQSINRTRLGGGLDYSWKKKNTLKLFSFYQSGSEPIVVTGLNYSRQL